MNQIFLQFQKATTITERLRRDLHFAICTNCTASRPSFVQERDPRDFDDLRDEIFEDLNLKPHPLSESLEEQTSPIGNDHLTIVPMNHLPGRTSLR